jgi:hypothetical protein
MADNPNPVSPVPVQPIPPAILAALALLSRLTAKSWKTTLASLVAAFLFIYPEIAPLLSGQHVSKRTIATAVCIALMGYFARDKNVSSEQQAGIVKQP